MSNIVGINGGKPRDKYEDHYYFIIKYHDGSVEAIRADFLGSSPNNGDPMMVLLSGPEEEQVVIANLNRDYIQSIRWIPVDQCEVVDGKLMFHEDEISEGEGPWEEGYV